LGKTPLSLFSWNNKQYGLPTGIALWSLGYNKDMVATAGAAAPDPVKPMTWAQLMSLAQKLTIKKAGKTSQYGILPASAIDPWNLVVMEGGQFYDRQIKPTKMMVNTPAGIRGLADWQSMFTLGVTPPYDHWADFAGGYFQGMQTGKIAMAAIGPWNFSTIASTTIKVGLMPTPRIAKTDMESGANGFCIYKGSKNVEAAWEFLKWAVSTKPQLEYVTFSDIPANTAAFSQMDSAIKPAEFAPTLHAEVAEYQPGVISLATTLSSAINTVLTDLARGKLTPAKAAAQIESVGNDAINQY
jgi:multiple sugar transport system substrate-binding protein